MEPRRIASMVVATCVILAALYGVWVVVAAGKSVSPWVMALPLYFAAIGGGWLWCDLYEWEPRPKSDLVMMAERLAAGHDVEDIKRDMRERIERRREERGS